MVSPGPVHLDGRSELATHVSKVNQLHTRTHKDFKQKHQFVCCGPRRKFSDFSASPFLHCRLVFREHGLLFMSCKAVLKSQGNVGEFPGSLVVGTFCLDYRGRGSIRVSACLRAQSSDSADPMDSSPPGSLRGIFRARILEWVAMLSSRESSQPRGQTRISCTSCILRRILYH